jgi:hypothetical protein
MTRPASRALSSLHSAQGDRPSTGAAASSLPSARRHSIFLGVDAQGAPYFAYDLKDIDAATAAVQWASSLCGQHPVPPGSVTLEAEGSKAAGPLLPPPSQAGVEWRAVRALDLSPEEGALSATAVGVAQV